MTSISASVVPGSPISASVTSSGAVYAWVEPGQSIVSVGVTGGISQGGPGTGTLTPVGGSSSSASQSNYVISPDKPPGMIWFSTRMESGTFSFSAKSDTGYFAVRWWDGSTSSHGTGNTTQYVTASKAVPTSGSYARSSPKAIYVWPTSSSGSLIQSGNFTGFACSSRKITALSTSDCTSLVDLTCDSNGMEYLDASRCNSVATLTCHNNRLRSLDLTTLTSLKNLYCQSNLLEAIDVSHVPGLLALQCNSNFLTSINLVYSTDLLDLFCHDNQITSLLIISSKSLRSLNCSGNELQSVRAVGVSFANPFGANLEGNNLQGSALNQFYADLSTAPAGQSPPIYVGGNPGTGGDNPFTATTKGYAVYGS